MSHSAGGEFPDSENASAVVLTDVSSMIPHSFLDRFRSGNGRRQHHCCDGNRHSDSSTLSFPVCGSPFEQPLAHGSQRLALGRPCHRPLLRKEPGYGWHLGSLGRVPTQEFYMLSVLIVARLKHQPRINMPSDDEFSFRKSSRCSHRSLYQQKECHQQSQLLVTSPSTLRNPMSSGGFIAASIGTHDVPNQH
jgi:hypothetical protein